MRKGDVMFLPRTRRFNFSRCRRAGTRRGLLGGLPAGLGCWAGERHPTGWWFG